MLFLLRPPPLPQRSLFSALFPAPIDLRSPSPILPQPHLRITRVIEIDLANRRLDQRPYPPIQARYTPEFVYLVEETTSEMLLFGSGGKGGGERGIGGDVFGEESTADRAGGKDAKVAGETTPFGEVVGYIKGGGGRDGIFVVYEGNRLDRRGIELGRVGGLGKEDYVAAEEVGVAEDELCGG